VDNASADGSADMIATEFPEFRLIRSETNLGFTGGHNRALAERKGHHAALLNSDTVVHPGAIGTLLEFMRANPEVGVVGPKLLNPDGSLQFSCRRFVVAVQLPALSQSGSGGLPEHHFGSPLPQQSVRQGLLDGGI